MDVYNREIIGYAVGDKKDVSLVYKAFSSVKGTLENIQIFHTDRGNAFKNKGIEELVETFEIKRSLSAKGCPYDTAVAEATYKIIKTEFVFDKGCDNLEELEMQLHDYVNGYNTIRIHSALGYQTPIAYKQQTL